MRNFDLNRKLPSKTVLVVEDDEISFLVLSEYLKQKNYKVVWAVNGKEAVSLVKNSKNPFSLILMDILMPEMNGFKATEKIKLINGNIPIIAQTAVAFDWNNDDDFANFDYFITKPLDFQKLGELIYSAVNKKNSSNLLEFQTN
ncbi:MAG: response regulator [Bacteroidota bacterium]